MQDFITSNTQAAQTMYNILHKAEEWNNSFTDAPNAQYQKNDLLKKGLEAFFWHIFNIGQTTLEATQDEEVKDASVDAVFEIVQDNPAVLYLAMEEMYRVAGSSGCNSVLDDFENQWRNVTGEDPQKHAYSPKAAKSKLEEVRKLFGVVQ